MLTRHRLQSRTALATLVPKQIWHQCRCASSQHNCCDRGTPVPGSSEWWLRGAGCSKVSRLPVRGVRPTPLCPLVLHPTALLPSSLLLAVEIFTLEILESLFFKQNILGDWLLFFMSSLIGLLIVRTLPLWIKCERAWHHNTWQCWRNSTSLCQITTSRRMLGTYTVHLDSKLTAQRNNKDYLKYFLGGDFFKPLLTRFEREKRNSGA